MRCWDPSDAALLADAFEKSSDELARWIPWVLDGADDPARMIERLTSYRDHFLEGGDALYAIMDLDETEVIGGIGLYRRVGAGALEVGYWVRSDVAGLGIATSATTMLTEAGLTLPGIERIEVHCDPANGASNAIPKKLGYRVRETKVKLLEQTGAMAETMIWEITSQMLSVAYARS